MRQAAVLTVFYSSCCTAARLPLRISLNSAAARMVTDTCWSAICHANGISDLTIGRDVELRETPSRGIGVFALRTLPADTFVCRYSAEVRNTYDQEVAARAGLTTGDFAMALQGDDWYLDAENPKRSNFARFLNHSVRRCNVAIGETAMPPWVGGLGTLVPTAPFAKWFYTIREIKAGEELCIDYGMRLAIELGSSAYALAAMLTSRDRSAAGAGENYWDLTLDYNLRNVPMLSSLRRLDPRRIIIDYF